MAHEVEGLPRAADKGPGDDFYGITAEDVLSRWDSGLTIWSIECGGLGPGYEQGLQVLAVEIVREAIQRRAPRDAKLDEAKMLELADAAVKRLGRLYGYSGAQVGMARWLAGKWLRVGPAALVREAKDRGQAERMIQVDRYWCRAPDHDPYPRPTRELFFSADKLDHVGEDYVNAAPPALRADRRQDVEAAKRVLFSPEALKLQLQRSA